MKLIDDFLNNITMYRLVLYYLIFLVLSASLLSVFGLISFPFYSIIFSSFFLIAVCYISNSIFSKLFKVPANTESSYITAIILSLIITPARSLNDLPFLFFAGLLAIASKYIIAINKKHIFNPAAFVVTLTSIISIGSASWWVGTPAMLPFILIGHLIIRKIQRYNLVFFFLTTFAIALSALAYFSGNDLLLSFENSIFNSPILFFSYIMLIEPLTTPPTIKLQRVYGLLVGILYSLPINFITPEIALLIGNVFSYIVSSKERLVLTLKRKSRLGNDIYEFLFPVLKFNYLPGQYMEWTLGHNNPDTRGNRRYFTLASSPTEDNLRIGVKFSQNSSTFKKSLLLMANGKKIVSGQLAGDFIMPKNTNIKLVFIAGGIGITPFRSMIKYLLDKNEKRNVILIYSNRDISEISYSDVFGKAEKNLGIKTVYTLTDTENIPTDWKGKTGHINENFIRQEVPNFKERIFYLSGPHSMTSSFEKVLSNMGVSRSSIKTDFFPGYA